MSYTRDGNNSVPLVLPSDGWGSPSGQRRQRPPPPPSLFSRARPRGVRRKEKDGGSGRGMSPPGWRGATVAACVPAVRLWFADHRPPATQRHRRVGRVRRTAYFMAAVRLAGSDTRARARVRSGRRRPARASPAPRRSAGPPARARAPAPAAHPRGDGRNRSGWLPTVFPSATWRLRPPSTHPSPALRPSSSPSVGRGW